MVNIDDELDKIIENREDMIPFPRGRPVADRFLMDDFAADSEPKPKKPYKPKKRDWRAYNLGQTSEKPMMLNIINALVRYLNIKTVARRVGRPPAQISDMIQSCLIKTCCGMSSRRNIGELELAELRRYIDYKPHFNSIINYMNDSAITQYLYEINSKIVELVAPLEKCLAIDSTGISSASQDRWVKVRLDFQKHREYRKLHVVAGVKTHIIAYAIVTDGACADSPQFANLLSGLSPSFKPKAICADAAYLSKENAQIVANMGAKPFIKPRSNIRPKNNGCLVWGNMIKLFVYNLEEFLKYYNLRVQVETTFSALKRKFNPYVKSKKPKAQENEILCKVICYNISVIIHLFFATGLKLDFLD
jgi:transposase